MKSCETGQYRRCKLPYFLSHLPAFRLVTLLLAGLLFPGSSTAQMKLLSPTTGWFSSGGQLYWTADSGATWKNITPVAPSHPSASSWSGVFFRNTSEGWATVSYTQITAANQRATDVPTKYLLAHTRDAGKSWSFTNLSYPALGQALEDAFAGPGDLYFFDSKHGWVGMDIMGNSRPGKLLMTSNGGTTWQWVNSPPVSGRIMFHSLQDGWLVGADADRLYVTHDGCSSWQEVGLDRPVPVGSLARPIFEIPPVFQNEHTGFVVVRYLDKYEPPSQLVVYATSDMGHTWRIMKVFTESPDSGFGGSQVDIVDSLILAPTSGRDKDLKIVAVPLQDGDPAGITVSAPDALTLSFADRENGWALTSTQGLLATHDGGATWNHIGPSYLK